VSRRLAGVYCGVTLRRLQRRLSGGGAVRPPACFTAYCGYEGEAAKVNSGTWTRKSGSNATPGCYRSASPTGASTSLSRPFLDAHLTCLPFVGWDTCMERIMRALPVVVAVLVPLAVSACEIAEPVPTQVTGLQGMWNYSASFTWREDTLVTQRCEIAGLTLTVGEATWIRHGDVYELDAQAFGGTLGCTGVDVSQDFVQDLVATSVGASSSPFGGFAFDFTISTSLGQWTFEHFASPFSIPDHVLSADYISGTVSIFVPTRASGDGDFMAVRR
jgi:hypothetical protein